MLKRAVGILKRCLFGVERTEITAAELACRYTPEAKQETEKFLREAGFENFELVFCNPGIPCPNPLANIWIAEVPADRFRAFVKSVLPEKIYYTLLKFDEQGDRGRINAFLRPNLCLRTFGYLYARNPQKAVLDKRLITLYERHQWNWLEKHPKDFILRRVNDIV